MFQDLKKTVKVGTLSLHISVPTEEKNMLRMA